MALAQLFKTHPLTYVNIQIPPLLRGGIDRQVSIAIALFFGLNRIGSNKSLGGTRLKK